MSEEDNNDNSQQAIGAGSGGRKFDQGFTKNMKVIGIFMGLVFLVVAVLLFMVLSGGEKASAGQGAVAIDQGMTTARARPAEGQAPTPAQQEMLRQQQVREAEEAQAQGRFYIPPDSAGAMQQVQTPMQSSNMQGAVDAYEQQYQSQRAQAIREGLKTQLSMIIQPTVNPGAARQTITADKNTSNSGLSSQRAGSGNAQGSATEDGQGQAQGSTQRVTQQASSSAATPSLIDAFEIVPARLASPITAIMGKQSYASALLTAGPYKGAFLVGTSTLNENETIETVFTGMRIGNKAYRIDAIILDEQTAAMGVKGDVDRRILQRYVLPIAVAMAQGYFTAASQTGSTSVAIGGSTTAGTSTPAPTDEQARNAGVAAGLGIWGRNVQKDADSPIRASVESNMTIGILFRAAVKDELR